jgi:hypothetical protein
LTGGEKNSSFARSPYFYSQERKNILISSSSVAKFDLVMRVLNVVVKKVFVMVSFFALRSPKMFCSFVLFANHVKKTLSVLTVSPPPPQNAHPSSRRTTPSPGALQQPVQNSNVFLLKDYYTDGRGRAFHPLVR